MDKKKHKESEDYLVRDTETSANKYILCFCEDCGVFLTPQTMQFPCPPWAEHESGGITNAGRVCEGVEVQELKNTLGCIEAYILYGEINYARNAMDILKQLIRTHEGQAET